MEWFGADRSQFCEMAGLTITPQIDDLYKRYCYFRSRLGGCGPVGPDALAFFGAISGLPASMPQDSTNPFAHVTIGTKLFWDGGNMVLWGLFRGVCPDPDSDKCVVWLMGDETQYRMILARELWHTEREAELSMVQRISPPEEKPAGVQPEVEADAPVEVGTIGFFEGPNGSVITNARVEEIGDTWVSVRASGQDYKLDKQAFFAD